MAERPDQPESNRPKHSARSHHRSQQHQEAHAEVSQPQTRHQHPLVCNAPPRLVTNQIELSELILHLRAAGSFAYDSEFIGELTYVPKLCLIQVATTTQVALVDPLAEIDLAPFWELVADASIEKIVHAGEQDVEPVFRFINKPPANLFDTQIAGGFIAMGYPLSLSKLVYAMVGAKLAKGLTFTYWDKRPLSEQQLRYAADDVRYLPAIRQEMGKQLEARGHAAWAKEESEALADPKLHLFDRESQYLRIRGATGLPAQNLAVLRELTHCRDTLARRDDVPPRTLLKDEVLLEMARRPVKEVEALSRVRGLPRPVENNYGGHIVEATLLALSMNCEHWPVVHNHEPLPREKFAADGLWAAAQLLCLGRGIDIGLVTGRGEIGELYRLFEEKKSCESLDLFQGWRREAVGATILAFLGGQKQIHGQWHDEN